MSTSKARHAQRAKEAADRQAQYDSLTIEQKIARAKSRRGSSTRELNRLHKKLAEAK